MIKSWQVKIFTVLLIAGLFWAGSGKWQQGLGMIGLFALYEMGAIALSEDE